MHDRYSPPNRWRALRTWGVRALAVLLTLGLSATVLEAQSLAAVARTEAARRKAVKADAKVYTNRNLGSDATSPAPPASAQAAPAAKPAAETPAQPDDKKDVKDEKYLA